MIINRNRRIFYKRLKIFKYLCRGQLQTDKFFFWHMQIFSEKNFGPANTSPKDLDLLSENA